jgi:hypothetical protein
MFLRVMPSKFVVLAYAKPAQRTPTALLVRIEAAQ